MENVLYFGVIEALESKGIINTLKRYYDGRECTDVAAFTLATKQIRSCSLCKFITPVATVISSLQF